MNNKTSSGHTGTAVLLIDDDELVAGSLRHYLAAQGCAVDVAVEARSAEKLMGTTQYDVVLVDPYLTGEVHRDDGASLLENVRLMQPHAAVIVLTGYGSPALLRIAAESKYPVVSKPQSVVSLAAVIACAGDEQLSQSAANRLRHRGTE